MIMFSRKLGILVPMNRGYYRLNVCVPEKFIFKKLTPGTSLVVRWLRLPAPKAGAGVGLIPSQELDPIWLNEDFICQKRGRRSRMPPRRPGAAKTIKS